MNWDDVTGAARSDHERHLIDDLRTVADIAQVHRVFASAPERRHDPPLDLSGWGDLEVIERLGGGGFGDVYLARDGRLNRLVALKVLAQSVTAQGPLAAQLLEEARILARVRHPNVVGVFGAAVHRGGRGRLLDGVRSRATRWRMAVNDGPLGADEAAAVGRQVCRALAAVHNAGLIHRDVKARNIMRERGGRIVLMDFGAGIPIEQPAEGPGARVGTPMYLARDARRRSGDRAERRVRGRRAAVPPGDRAVPLCRRRRSRNCSARMHRARAARCSRPVPSCRRL